MSRLTSNGIDLSAARILVVDDESANLKLLRMMLRTEGYQQVELLQDPRLVEASYRRARPDLMLLDINMPHLDGFAVMEQIKALGDDPAPPILVLTAQPGEDFMLRALAGGAVDFLTKPFNRRELLARMHNVLLAHQARCVLQGRNGLLEHLVQQRTVELRESRPDIVRRLGRAAEFRDNETGQHIVRMSHACALLARAAGWDAADCELMLHASPMHDIGKIGIPDGILLKAGPLSADEWEVMQTHTTIGAMLLKGDGDALLDMASDIAMSHHEKWDGSGYPQRLAGEHIPEAARIVAIADVFDALTSARPYKKPWTVPAALDYMGAHAGKHFDARLFGLFTTLLPQVLEICERFCEAPMAVHEEAALESS